MGIPAAKHERKNQEQITRDVIGKLLAELGNARAQQEFSRLGLGANLERDLGLGSLERVELLLRLDAAFSIHLPESVVAQADTVADLVHAVAEQSATPEKAKARIAAEPARETPSESSAAIRKELLEQISQAETLTDVIRIRGRADASRAHILLYEESGDVRTITCGELYERGNATAVELARRGIRPGNTVAIMLPTGADFFFTFAGILLAGAIPVPIYPPFRADRIEEYATRQAGILRNAEVRLLVTFRQAEGLAKLLEPLAPSLRGVVTAERIAESGAAAAPPETEIRPTESSGHRGCGSDIAFLQYTSGSTGNPKGVVLTHKNLLANIQSIREAMKINENDVAVSWLPLYHDMGLIGAWFVPLTQAIPLVLLSPLAFLTQPIRWLQAIDRHRGTLSPAPNFAYELCVRKIPDGELEGLDLSSWRAALNGAEPVRAETIERFAEKFARCGFRREALLSVYGLAEASLGVAAPAPGAGTHVDRIQRAEFEKERRAIPAASRESDTIAFVSAGKPLPKMEIRVVDAGGREAAERTEGKLLFRGPSATSGYYRNPEATRELVREDGWLDSGDLAYVADGSLYITGRAKDLIIKGGRNLYPQEIEEIAGRVGGVRTGCVVAFGVPDVASGTERLVVAAEVRDFGARERIGQEITREVSGALGMPPDIVEILPPHSIPKTSSGKLRRSETRRLYLNGELTKAPAAAWMQIAKLSIRTAGPRFFSVSRRTAQRFLEIIYGVYALALFGVAAMVAWIIVLPLRNRRLAARILSASCRLLLSLVAMRVYIEGQDMRADWKRSAPWIFAPNHSSYLDILVIAGFLPSSARFVAKGEIRKMPLVGTIATRSGHFAFDRSDPQARVAQEAEIEEALRQGDSVVIYPEGTFTAAAGIRPFQLGAFKAAVNTARPICPVAVRGARELLRDKTWLPKPGRVTLTFGPLISPRPGTENDWHEIVRLRDETREIIAAGAAEPLL